MSEATKKRIDLQSRGRLCKAGLVKVGCVVSICDEKDTKTFQTVRVTSVGESIFGYQVENEPLCFSPYWRIKLILAWYD